MEAPLNEGDGVIDARARLIAGDHRLDEIATASAAVLADGKRRRQDLARMQRLGADIGIVEVERADENAIDEQGAFDGGGPRIADDRGRLPLAESLADSLLGDGGSVGTNGAECTRKRIEED